jgi:hypothetical protein
MGPRLRGDDDFRVAHPSTNQCPVKRLSGRLRVEFLLELIDHVLILGDDTKIAMPGDRPAFGVFTRELALERWEHSPVTGRNQKFHVVISTNEGLKGSIIEVACAQLGERYTNIAASVQPAAMVIVALKHLLLSSRTVVRA